MRVGLPFNGDFYAYRPIAWDPETPDAIFVKYPTAVKNSWKVEEENINPFAKPYGSFHI